MTTRQRSELEAAIDRATEHGIDVVGHGHRKSDGAKIYCTTSHSEANRWHIVALVGNRLTCDCHSRKLCSHRAAVHMYLVVQLAERAARAEEIECELEAEETAGTTPARAVAHAPRPRTDTRAFSVFK